MSTLENDLAEETEEHTHWVSRAAFQVIVVWLGLTQVAIAFALARDAWWLVLPLALLASHLMHGMLIAFHEASHGLLRRSRKLNDLDGLLLGTMSFMSFTLYRTAHQLHHAHLGTERDEELWPFVHPSKPRWVRVLAAAAELTCGMAGTPALFARIFLRRDSPIRSPRVRRRIWLEYALMAVVWAGVVTAVALTGTWKYLLWLYFIPGFIAADLQSWRKYIEHVGLTGRTVNSATRSIVPHGRLGRFFALTLLHEPFHGVHHRRAGLPHSELPQFAFELAPAHPDETAPYPSYRHALRDLLGKLRDPQVGAQWRHADVERNK